MAAHAHAHAEEIRDPGPLAIPGGLQALLLVFAVIGIATFGIGLTTDAKRTWISFLHNHFYFLSLAIGGMFFAAIQWVTSAMWSAPIRRIFESFTAYLPVALVMFVVLYFGLHHLYVWTDPAHVNGDIVLEGKKGYLNVPFFMIRNIVAFVVWILFARKMIGNSLAQDKSKAVSLTLANRWLSPPFLIVFGVTYTMMAFDLFMSLDPHWFSTMFGVYCFAGMFYSMLALTCLITLWLKGNGKLEGIVNHNHLHDLGKFMFAFTIFYAYIGFSQFMLIWYANLPEETGYFMRRFDHGWLYVSIFLLAGKFMVPFFVLLPRDSKRNETILFGIGSFMLVAHWIDLMWLTQPEFFRNGPMFGLTEIGVTLGFIGIFGTCVLRFLSQNSVVAIGDPKLSQAVFHHHQ